MEWLAAWAIVASQTTGGETPGTSAFMSLFGEAFSISFHRQTSESVVGNTGLRWGPGEKTTGKHDAVARPPRDELHPGMMLDGRPREREPDIVGCTQPPERFTRPQGVLVDPPAWMRATAFARIAPSFLVIGAQRSGSTTLHGYLTAHPRILPPLRKEVHYFDFQYAKGRAWYLAHFPGIHKRIADHLRAITFEASPYYMVHPLAPERIWAFNPEMKLIAILRDPVDRALSHYHHEVRRGVETLSFEEAIAAERTRLAGAERLMRQAPHFYSHAHHHFSYLDRGRYARHLEPWLERFPREHLLVLRSEDLFSDPEQVMNRVFGFLGLPSQRVPTGAGRRQSYASIPPDLRERLRGFFAEDRQRLEKLLR